MQFIKDCLNKIDPYRQSFLYFKWDFWGILICTVAVLYLCKYVNHAFELQYSQEVTSWLFDNRFVYLPNYLVHEMLGHNTVGRIGWRICYHSCYGLARWWSALTGNGVETGLPLLCCFAALRLKGGRYLLPILMYWLSTTLYGAGIYAADARAMKLRLTSSDMMSNFAPGEVLGDWHHILEPLGLLQYDVIIGHLLAYMGVVCFVLAVWSIWYYWTHIEDYTVL